jgi:hypothetical protein
MKYGIRNQDTGEIFDYAQDLPTARKMLARRLVRWRFWYGSLPFPYWIVKIERLPRK